MATVAELASMGVLIRHEGDLEAGEMPHRFVYYPASFEEWVLTVVSAQTRDRSRDLTPFEQVEQMLHDFIVKRPLRYGQDDRKLDPLNRHVWELKSEDIRLVGWFPARATFVAVCGGMRKDLKPFRAYTPLIDKACSFRDVLDLDPPKMLIGNTHADVL